MFEFAGGYASALELGPTYGLQRIQNYLNRIYHDRALPDRVVELQTSAIQTPAERELC